MNTAGSLSGVAKLRVEARQLTGSTNYPVLVLAGAARPTAAPFLSAKPGRWTCNSGTNSWVCQRELPVGTVANDTLDLQWSIPSGIVKIDSIRPISGGWTVYLGSAAALPPSASRDFSILGTTSVKLGDRVKVGAGSIGAGNTFEAGVNDTMGDVLVKGNVTLRDNAVLLGHLTYGGTINISPTAKVLSGIDRAVPTLPTVATATCTPGTTDVTLNSGKRILAPGSYRNLTVNAGAELELSGGVYHFSSVTFQANAILTLKPGTTTPIDIRVSSQLSLGDMMSVRPAAGAEPEMVRWTYNGTGTVRLGTGVTFFGWFRAPSGTIVLSGRTKVLGGVHAANVQVEPDCYGVFQGINNAAPSIGGTPKDTVTVGKTWQFVPTGTDPEGEALTWSLVKAPTGAAINASSGAISWVADSVRIAAFELKACDASGSCSELSWTVSAFKSNTPPYFTPATVTASGTEGVAWTYTSMATDPDGDAMTWSVVGALPTGMTFNTSTHVLNWTPTFAQSGAYVVTLKVKAGADSAIQTINLAIANKNQLPVFSPTSVTTNGTESVAWSYTSTATDADGDALTWSVVGALPTGMTFNSSTHVLNWTPNFTQSGTHVVTLRVKDATDSATQTINLTIANKNQIPVTVPPVVTSSGTEGVAWSHTSTGTDADGDPLTWTVVGDLPSGMTFNSSSRLLSWTPSFTQSGTYVVTLRVKDATDSATQTINLTIANANQAPVVTPATVTSTGTEGVAWSYASTATDADGDVLTWSVVGELPAGMTFNPSSHALAWTPSLSQSGTYVVTLRVKDATDSATQTINLTIANQNQAPVVTPATVTSTGTEGVAWSYTSTATDADSDALTWSVVGELPAGMTFNPSTHVLSWTPTLTQSGAYVVTLRVKDATDSATQTINLTIANQNQVPVFTPATVTSSGTEGVAWSYASTATDADGDALTWSVVGELPTGMTFNSSSHVLSWTPTLTQSGAYVVTLRVKDATDSATQTINLTIANQNQVPVFTPATVTSSGTEGVAWSYASTATDADGDALTWSVVGELPTGMTFNSSSHVLSWTPTLTQSGAYVVTLRVKDATDSATQTINLTIANANQAPVVTPVTVTSTGTEGVAWSHTSTASDADGDVLTWSVVGDLPAGMTFNPLSHVLSWTPTLTQSGAYVVTLRVKDATDSATQTINLTIANANQEPVITSSPASTGKEGVVYRYTVSASDPDGDALSFFAGRMPMGMHFDLPTRTIVWTPDFVQAGSHPVSVSVSDGRNPPIEQSWTVVVSDSNRAPVLTSHPPVSVREGTTYAYQVTAVDPDGDPLVYSSSLVGSIQGAPHFDPGTQMMLWEVGFHAAGTRSFDVAVSDGKGGADQQNWIVTIQDSNRVPVFTPATVNSTGTEGVAWSYTSTASDADGDVLTWSVVGELPTGMTFNSSSHVLSWTPGFSQSGQYVVTLMVKDAADSAQQTIDLTIADQNRPPVIGSIAPVTAKEGALYSYVLAVTDPDNDPLVVQPGPLPIGMTFDAVNSRFEWMPGFQQSGSHAMSLTVSDGANPPVRQDWSISVADSNRPPEILSMPASEASIGQRFEYHPVGTDLDGDPLVWSLDLAPVGMQIDPVTGAITWTPTSDQSGILLAKLKTADGKGGVYYQSFRILVRRPNAAPVFTSTPSLSVRQGVPYRYLMSAQDPDGDALSYSLKEGPVGSEILGDTLVWRIPETMAPLHRFQLIVRDGHGGRDTQEFEVRVWEIQETGVVSGKVQANARIRVSTLMNADDHYALFMGGPNGENLRYLGRNETSIYGSTGGYDWHYAEQYDTTISLGEFVYAAAWDVGGSKMFMGQVTFGDSILVASDTASWRVSDSIDLPNPGLNTPTTSDVDHLIHRANWKAPRKDYSNGQHPYWFVPGFPPEAQMLWKPPADYLLFRSRYPVLAGMIRPVQIAVYLDENGNGSRDPGESFQIPDSAGAFRFEKVNPGSYQLRLDTLPGWGFAGGFGMIPLTVNARDSVTGLRFELWADSVRASNSNPVVPLARDTVTPAGQLFEFQMLAQDPDGDSLSYFIVKAPLSSTIDASGVFHWQATDGAEPVHPVVLGVQDGHGGYGYSQFSIHLNQNPILDGRCPEKGVIGDAWRCVFHASDLDGDAVSISPVSVPQGFAFTGSHEAQWTPTSPGTYSLLVRADDGRGGYSFQDLVVQVGSRLNHPPVILGVPANQALAGHAYTYRPQVQDEDGDAVILTLRSGPVGSVFDASSGEVRWTPTVEGTARFELEVADVRGASLVQAWDVVVESRPNGNPNFQSQPSTRVRVGAAFQYSPVVSDPENDPIQLVIQNGPAGLTLDSQNKLTWTPSTTDIGNHQVLLGASDGHGGQSSQSFVLQVLASLNQAPAIQSNPSMVATLGVPYASRIQATDSGAGVFTYRLVNGPSGMTIDPDGVVRWTPFASPIPQSVEVEVANSYGSSRQTWSIQVLPDVSAPSLRLEGPDSVVVGQNALIRATGSDNGGVFSSRIEFESQFSTSGVLNVVSTKPGEIVVHGIAEDPSGNRSFAAKSIVVLPVVDDRLPVVQLQVSSIGQVGVPLPIRVLATDDIGLDLRGPGLRVDGSPLRLENGLATYTPSHAGLILVEAMVYDRSGNLGKAEAMVSVTSPGLVSGQILAQIDGPARVADSTGMLHDPILISPTVVSGTARADSLAYYVLEIARPGEPWQEVSRSFENVSNGFLGALDPTLLENGSWILRLRVVDATGAAMESTAPFQVSGEKKIGVLNLAFRDLSIPLSGLSIEAIRMYDSRSRNVPGDFGFGWSLSFSRCKVMQNVPQGQAWTYRSQGPFQRQFVSTQEHTISVQLPGIRTQEFTVQPHYEVGCDQGICITDPSRGYVTYDPKPGTLGELQPADISNRVILMGGMLVSEDALVDPDGELKTFQPDLYQLKMIDGSEWLIRQSTGEIFQMRDPNGNVVQFQGNSVIHSDGPGFQIERDDRNRITSIADQAGRIIRYGYDLDGNLASVTDAMGRKTKFSYDVSRYLTDIIDARGIHILGVGYDSMGRMTSQIGPNGDTVNLFHDLESGREITRSPRGDSTIYAYNAKGYVTSKTVGNKTWNYTLDAEGHVVRTDYPDGTHTSSRFDEWGNELESVDALGNATTRTFRRFTDKILSETDPMGRTQTYEYDESGNLLRSKNAAGLYNSRLGYDQKGNVVSDTDATGGVTSSVYDGLGRKILQTDVLGRSSQWRFDLLGNTLLEIDPIGRTTRYEYDADGNRIATLDPLGRRTSTEYTSFGKPRVTIDVMGRKVTTHFDVAGQSLGTTNPDGTSTSRAYDNAGNVTTTTDVAGRTVSMSYDAENRLTATTFPDGTRVRSEYDAMGRRIASIDARGNRTEFAYDALGRDTLVRDALGNVTRSRYDIVGRKIEVIDALGRSTRTHYDIHDRVTSTVYADGSKDSTEYDVAGRKTATIDAEGRRTEFGYDAVGQLTHVKDANGQVTRYTYDAVGNRLTQTDAKGRTTKFRYDILGRQVAKEYPDGAIDSTVYDLAGRVAKHIAPNGEVSTYEYDIRDREVKRSYLTSGHTVLTTWNQDGSRSTVQDERGLTQYTYDARGRLAGQTNPDGVVLRWTFDSAGRIERRITPWGTTRYHYNVVGQMDSTVDSRVGAIANTYDALGRVVSVSRPNGVTSRYTYSLRGLQDTVLHQKGATELARFSYAFDRSGLRIGSLDNFGSTTTPVEWNHDSLMRLTQESKAGVAQSWSYDAVSNRTQQVSGGNTIASTFDVRDRLTSLGATTYTWDVAGRLTGKHQAGVGTTRLAWQDNDRLTHVELPNGSGVDYTYDAQGLLATRTDAQGTERYTWDGTLPYGQMVATTNAAGDLLAREVWGSEHLAEVRNDTILWLLTDGLGHVRAVVDSVGQIVARQDFDAWGNRTLDSGRTVRFGYRGEWSDPATGLVFLRARWMDPTTGRFVSEDPFEGNFGTPATLHRFLYANGGPVNGVDPSGRMTLLQFSVVTGILTSLTAMSITSYNIVHQGGSISENAGTIVESGVYGFAAGFMLAADLYLAVPAIGVSARYLVGLQSAPLREVVIEETIEGIPVAQGMARVAAIRGGGSPHPISRGKNIAVADFEIDGIEGTLVGISGQNSPKGTCVVTNSPQFETTTVGWPRKFDSEVKIFEEVAQFATPASTGVIRLFTENPSCTSCLGVADQFQRMFPRIRVIVTSGPGRGG